MSKNASQKLIDLETSLGLLQHDFDKQNDMLLQTVRQVQQMEMTIKRLVDQVTCLHADSGESRTQEDEKPPHY